MASQFSTNTAANQARDREVADKLQQDYLRRRTNRELLKNPVEETLDALQEDITPTVGVQRNIKPLLPGESIQESMNPGNRTQVNPKQGTLTTAMGTIIPSSQIVNRLANRRKDFPANRASSVAEGYTVQDYLDMGYSQEQAIGALAGAVPQTREQMGFNRGANVRLQDDFSNRNNLVDMLSADNTTQYARQVAREFPGTRETFLKNVDSVNMATKFDNIRGWTERFKTAFDKLFAEDMRLSNATDIEAVQNMLLRNNISARTLTEFLYNNVAPASQLMEGNSPNGLAGAMLLAVLQNAAEVKTAQDRTIQDLNQTPKNQADLDSWSDEDKKTYRNLENEMYSEAMGGVKSVGHLIAEAGQMKMTGNEMALMSEIAKKVAVDTFGDELFVKLPSAMGDRIQLTDNMTQWVNEDRNMMAHLLNQPLKLPRIGDEGIIPFSEAVTDFRSKGIPDSFNRWMDDKDISSKDFEELHKRALNVLNNTPHTTLVAQSRGLALMMGYNSQTGEFTNNVLTSLFDHNEYKAIKYGGEAGNRTLNVSKYDIATDEMKDMRDFSDTEKDNLVNLNLKAAIDYIGKQIRFDHFVGNNYRFYHEAQVLSPTSHLARSLLGSGSFIPYETNNQQHMMKLKAGIMTMTGLKVPGSKMKLSQAFFDVRADAFDANIENWLYKYGDIVEDMSMLDGSVAGAGLEINLMKELQDENSQTAQAMKDLIEYGQELDGYYTVNAVIEAVRLQQAINRGDPLYNSNYMFEVDGTSNGLSINALLTAERNMLAMTGVTEFLLNQESGYTYPEQYDVEGNLIPQTDTAGINMLTEPKPPEKLTETIINMLEMDSAPGKRNLLRLGLKNGLISDSASKGVITPAMYGAGEKNAAKLLKEAYMDVVNQDPTVEEELLDPYQGGFSSRDEIINTLSTINWQGLSNITGDLRTFNSLHSQFMDKIIQQYIDKEVMETVNGKQVGTGVYELPPPVTVLDSGYIMRHGEPVRTIHGAELPLPANLPGTESRVVRQMTNMIDPLGKKRNPKTGELYDYNGALTGAAVKMTHHVDAHMVFQMMLRQYAENPGAAHGVTGGVMLQMYDGFFGAPMYAEYMDRTLNEEFVNLGYRINNIRAMVNTAEAQGYDVESMSMRNLIAKMDNMMAKGQALLSQAYKDGGGLSVNQFQIMDGRVVKEPKLKDNKIVGFNFDDFTQRMDETRRGKKGRHVGGKFVGPIRNTKVWKKLPGNSAADVAAKEIEAAKRLEKYVGRKVKRVDPIRVGNFNNAKAAYKVGQAVIVSSPNANVLGKGIIKSFNNNKYGKFVGYFVRMEDGKTQQVKPEQLRPDIKPMPF